MNKTVFAILGVALLATTLTFLCISQPNFLRTTSKARHNQAVNLENLSEGNNALVNYGRNSLIGQDLEALLPFLLLNNHAGQGLGASASASNNNNNQNNLAHLGLLGNVNSEMDETFQAWALGGVALCNQNCQLKNLLCPLTTEASCIEQLNILVLANNLSKCHNYAAETCKASNDHCLANCKALDNLFSTAPAASASASAAATSTSAAAPAGGA